MTECSSPIHQFYPSEPARDPTLGLPPESYQAYDPNRSFGNSPLHTSPFNTSPSSNLNSPIQQNLFSQVPNLTMYSGTNSPIMNPLLSPSTSPVFGNYVQTQTAPGSISSITQGKATRGWRIVWLIVRLRRHKRLEHDRFDHAGDALHEPPAGDQEPADAG
jgi:hypothetical protein